MPEAFELLPLAKNESSISMYTVHRKAHQVPDQQGSGLQLCTEAGGAVAQQEAMNDHSQYSGDGEQDCRSLEDSEVVQKGAGGWAIAHTLKDLVGEQAWLQESVEWQEALLEEMVSNTKVITDAMDLFTKGEQFLRVLEMGKLEGPEESELVVRRHRRRVGKGKGKELERNPEVVPEGVLEVELEASCDVEMTLQ